MGMELVKVPDELTNWQRAAYARLEANDKALNRIREAYEKTIDKIDKKFEELTGALSKMFEENDKRIEEFKKEMDSGTEELHKKFENIDRLIAKMKADDVAHKATMRDRQQAEDDRWNAKMKAEKEAKAEAAKKTTKWLDRHPNFKAALPYIVIAAIVAAICIPVIIVCCLI